MFLFISFYESTMETGGDTESEEGKKKPEFNERNATIIPTRNSRARVIAKCLKQTEQRGTSCEGQRFTIRSDFGGKNNQLEEFKYTTVKDFPNGNKGVIYTNAKDKTDTFIAEYKDVNGEWVLQSYKRNYNYSIPEKNGFPNKIELEYPADFDEHASYSKIKIDGKELKDGGVMKVGSNGKLAVVNPDKFSDMENATIFMNGMNVDQRQMLDYAQDLNKTGGQDIYMVANIDKGLYTDYEDVRDARGGLYNSKSTRNAEKSKIEKEIRGLQGKIREKRITLSRYSSSMSNKKKMKLKKDINSLNAKIEEKEIEKNKLYDENPDTSANNPIRRFKDNAPINTVVKLLESGRVKKILSHSQGSLNVSVALGVVGKNRNKKKLLKGMSWTSMGGAYSERNIYELPKGLDVNLYYNDKDNVSWAADVNDRPKTTQERNQLARRKYGKDKVKIKKNGLGHDFKDYLWGSELFFGKRQIDEKLLLIFVCYTNDL